MGGLIPEKCQTAAQDIFKNVRPQIPDMRKLVHRRATTIHTHFVAVDWLKRFPASGSGVVKFKHSHSLPMILSCAYSWFVTTNKVRESPEKINSSKTADSLIALKLSGRLCFNESMALHCTFKVGGPVDMWYEPATVADLVKAVSWARELSIPVTVLGGGANVVPADKGIRGLVICTQSLDSCTVEGTCLYAGAGLAVSAASMAAAEAELVGLDFIYAMPGSVGGAVWMNARCYDGEIAPVLAWVDYLDENLTPARLVPQAGDFAYKLSPFQAKNWIITGAMFQLQPGNRQALLKRMQELEADRTSKGHFLLPCAGSVFKNNHAFGAPSGKIIDQLGLRSCRIGGAMVSEMHANIIVNADQALASDIKKLVTLIQHKVVENYGYKLEPEVLFVGDWD